MESRIVQWDHWHRTVEFFKRNICASWKQIITRFWFLPWKFLVWLSQGLKTCWSHESSPTDLLPRLSNRLGSNALFSRDNDSDTNSLSKRFAPQTRFLERKRNVLRPLTQNVCLTVFCSIFRFFEGMTFITPFNRFGNRDRSGGAQRHAPFHVQKVPRLTNPVLFFIRKTCHTTSSFCARLVSNHFQIRKYPSSWLITRCFPEGFPARHTVSQQQCFLPVSDPTQKNGANPRWQSASKFDQESTLTHSQWRIQDLERSFRQTKINRLFSQQLTKNAPGSQLFFWDVRVGSTEQISGDEIYFSSPEFDKSSVKNLHLRSEGNHPQQKLLTEGSAAADLGESASDVNTRLATQLLIAATSSLPYHQLRVHSLFMCHLTIVSCLPHFTHCSQGWNNSSAGEVWWRTKFSRNSFRLRAEHTKIYSNRTLWLHPSCTSSIWTFTSQYFVIFGMRLRQYFNTLSVTVAVFYTSRTWLLNHSACDFFVCVASPAHVHADSILKQFNHETTAHMVGMEKEDISQPWKYPLRFWRNFHLIFWDVPGFLHERKGLGGDFSQSRPIVRTDSIAVRNTIFDFGMMKSSQGREKQNFGFWCMEEGEICSSINHRALPAWDAKTSRRVKMQSCCSGQCVSCQARERGFPAKFPDQVVCWSGVEPRILIENNRVITAQVNHFNTS